MKRFLSFSVLVLLAWVMSVTSAHHVFAHGLDHHDYDHGHAHASHSEEDCPICEFDFASFLAPSSFQLMDLYVGEFLIENTPYSRSAHSTWQPSAGNKGPPRLG